MKKSRKAQVATLALLLAAAGFAIVRNRPSSSAGQGPQDTVYAMLNAAKAGQLYRDPSVMIWGEAAGSRWIAGGRGMG